MVRVTGVLLGFGIIGTIIGIGYLVGRLGLLGEHAPFVLSRIVFFVLSPCLLFTVLATSNVHVLFSALLAVSALAAVVCCLIYVAVAGTLWRRPVPEVVVGALASGYVNANNIGIPVAVYVLGDPAYAAPVLLFQLLVLAPIALTALDLTTGESVSLRRILLQPMRNPLIIASALGTLVAITGLQLPAPVLEPFRIVGAAAVPMVLISFGMSLHGRRPLQPNTGRAQVLLATGIKLLVMPVVAWLVAVFVFSLNPPQVLAVTVLAALPSAQNVFNYAQRYGRGITLARDSVLLTTVGAVPVLLAVGALLSR